MKRIVPILTILALLAAPAAVAGKELTGSKATDFTFKDINPASETYGEEITLSETYAEGGVLVNFLASWCGYCWEELPVLQEMADAGEVRVLGMAADEYGAPAEILMRQIEHRELTLPILWVEPEQAEELEKRYTYQTLPATYVIESDGTIARVYTGVVEPERLRKEIVELLGHTD